MLEIIVGVGRSKFIGDYPKIELDEALSTFQTGFQYSKLYQRRRSNGDRIWDGKVHLLSRTNDSFPTGLLDIVISVLEVLSIKYELTFTDKALFKLDFSKFNPLPVKVGKYILRDYQIDSIKAFIEPNRLLPHRGIICAGTGSGKTVTAIALANILAVPTLFLVKGKALKDQTFSVFNEALGEDTVGIIDAKTWEPKQITVASVDTLASRLDTPKTAKKVLDFLKEITFVIADEVHRGTSQRYKDILNSTPAPLRLGLSGTPNKGYLDKDLVLHGLCGEIIHRIMTPELQEKGAVSQAELIGVIIDKPKLESLSWPDALSALIINNSERSSIIAKLVKKEWQDGKIILVMGGNSIPLTENLYRAILAEVGDEDAVRHITGQSPSDYVNETFQMAREKKLAVVVTTVIADEGIDIPEINTLFICNGGKSFVKTIQRIGRGLRVKADGSALRVMEFFDKTNHYLKKHAMKRLDHYEAEKLFSKTSIINGSDVLAGKV